MIKHLSCLLLGCCIGLVIKVNSIDDSYKSDINYLTKKTYEGDFISLNKIKEIRNKYNLKELDND